MTTILVELDASELQGFFKRLDRALDRNIPMALGMAGRRIGDRAKRILDEGGHVKTGALRNSIGAGEVKGSYASGNIELEVGTSHGQAPVNYAEPVEKGTVPHIIRARESGARPHAQPGAATGKKAMLRFVVGGGFRFAKEVNHPGTQAVRFMERAVEAESDAIDELFEEAVADAIAQAEGR